MKAVAAHIAAVSIALALPLAATGQQAVFPILEDGTWGWPEGEGACSANPHSIRFADDRTKMWFSWAHDRDMVLYHILYVEGQSVTAIIDGEERRTEAGDRVVWVLSLLDSHHYCWRRTDWPAGSCTKTIEKCPATS